MFWHQSSLWYHALRISGLSQGYLGSMVDSGWLVVGRIDMRGTDSLLQVEGDVANKLQQVLGVTGIVANEFDDENESSNGKSCREQVSL